MNTPVFYLINDSTRRLHKLVIFIAVVRSGFPEFYSTQSSCLTPASRPSRLRITPSTASSQSKERCGTTPLTTMRAPLPSPSTPTRMLVSPSSGLTTRNSFCSTMGSMPALTLSAATLAAERSSSRLGKVSPLRATSTVVRLRVRILSVLVLGSNPKMEMEMEEDLNESVSCCTINRFFCL